MKTQTRSHISRRTAMGSTPPRATSFRYKVINCGAGYFRLHIEIETGLVLSSYCSFK